MYGLKFDLVRVDVCVAGMRGFWDSNMTHTKNIRQSNNVGSGSDDTDVDLDEEYDQWHWSVWGMQLYLFYIDLLIKL